MRSDLGYSGGINFYFAGIQHRWEKNLSYEHAQNLSKWSNTLKTFVGTLPTNCLSVFEHVVGLALKGLKTT